MRKGKISYCLGVLGACFIGGIGAYGIGSAHAVPGVDKPFDPANYYSMTSVSYADSAPSPFALKDLARQGGNVYDYARHMKAILATQNTENWLATALERFGIKVKNMNPLDNSILTTVQRNIASLNSDTESSGLGEKTLDFWKSKIFRSTEDGYVDESTYKPQEQYQAAASIYKYYGDNAKGFIDTAKSEQANITAIMEASNNAEGEMQADQAKADAMAMLDAETARRNTLLGNLASIKAVEGKIKQNEDLAFRRQVQDAQISIEDPYHRNERSKKLYEKSEPKGFVRF
ncbi:hypothetical protein [Selenomonas ruminis]|uniref:P-type conjugative transfer protein TrbJ n=1 Tax=Selenomonas ruminis TaxID=2593411 RepID=A0A5D6W111_9FIRM|nr:hypothetical protein [Selenomonas sp. mPRGC5]TYZ20475.1 hypothetical protein FZ040_11685 [Selenomonas sp. mPRGC5]